jgi:hypothetical protein
LGHPVSFSFFFLKKKKLQDDTSRKLQGNSYPLLKDEQLLMDVGDDEGA